MAYTEEEKENNRIIGLVYNHIDSFNDIYLEGNEANPMPDNIEISVYCSSYDENGFVFNTKVSELGLTALIARKWILHSKLEELIGERILA